MLFQYRGGPAYSGIDIRLFSCHWNYRIAASGQADKRGPRAIVCLGRIVWRELAGARVPFDPARPSAAEFAGAILLPMYHPAWVNRGAYSERAYARDFARLAARISALPN